MASSPIVEIQNVSFAYGREQVLQQVSLEIQPLDFIAMIGPNGGGKTTLLKLILGLIQPQQGIIRVNGATPGTATAFIGYVPQNVHINRNFPISVLDVVLMGAGKAGRRWRKQNAESRRDAMSALERLGMHRHAHRRMGSLSGGQRQRVFIARALVSRPTLLLLDEPTASIDTKGQAEFFRMLEELNDAITIVVVSHDLLVISRYVKSVACVNRRLHFHNQAEITGEMLETMYPCTVEENCPVELVAHGLPHRVLKAHNGEHHD